MRTHHSALLIVAVVVGLGVLTPLPTKAQSVGQLFVLVTDQVGEPVTGIGPTRFKIWEDNVPKRVLSAEPETTPMKIALMVDNSDAIDHPANAISSLRNGLTAFLDELPDQHEVSLVTIGGNIRQLVDFTTDRDELRAAADGLFGAGGPTRMIEGLMETWDRRFEDDDAWPVFVFVITDGPEGSRFVSLPELNAFIGTLVARGVTVHSVLLSTRGGGAQTQIAPLLAQNTGGLHEVIAMANGLKNVLTDLATAMGDHFDDVSRRYRVLYEQPSERVGAQIQATVVGANYRLGLFTDRWMPPQ
jgi:hypothetical protein